MLRYGIVDCFKVKAALLPKRLRQRFAGLMESNRRTVIAKPRLGGGGILDT